MNVCFLLPPIERYSPVSGGAIATKVIPIYCASRSSLSLFARGVSKLRRKVMRWDWLYYEFYLASLRQALRRMEKKPDAVLVFNDLITPRHVKREAPEAKVLCMLSNECRTNQRDIRKTIACVHKFVAVSRYIQDWTARRYEIGAGKILTIPNGADLETFHPRPNFLSPVSPLKALFIGRIDPNKGPDLAADAVTQLRKEGLPITLTVAGSQWFYGNDENSADPYFVALKEKMAAAKAEYAGHVTRTEVPGLVRRHDIACILSRSNDPMPQTTFEAMASGLAVVASNRGGIPEACDGAGWMVDVDDFESIVSALRTLTTIAPVLNEYKRRSVARANLATWDLSASALETVLSE
jgi:glycosyltransferase involved in cell wall biosynthesis